MNSCVNVSLCVSFLSSLNLGISPSVRVRDGRRFDVPCADACRVPSHVLIRSCLEKSKSFDGIAAHLHRGNTSPSAPLSVPLDFLAFSSPSELILLTVFQLICSSASCSATLPRTLVKRDLRFPLHVHSARCLLENSFVLLCCNMCMCVCLVPFKQPSELEVSLRTLNQTQ